MERTKKIVIQKDLDDHTGLAADIAAYFLTGPRWCDVTMLIQGAEFHSCKGILAAVSPYFRQLFSDLKDPVPGEIRLEGFTAAGFKAVWDYIHGTRIEVEGVEGALAALQDAHFLGLKRLCNSIGKVFLELLSLENAFRLLQVAEEYGCQELKEAAIATISARFYQVVGLGDFLSVSFETLAALLEREDLEISSEREVYEAMRMWVDHDEGRKGRLPDLLDKIRLPLLPYEYRKMVVARDPAIADNPSCLHVCINAMDYHVPELRHTVLGGKSRHRGTLSNKIWCLGAKSNVWKMYCINANDWSIDEGMLHPGYSYEYQPFRRETTNKAFAGTLRKLYLIACDEMKIFDIEKSAWEEGPKPPAYIQWAATAASPGSVFVCGNYDQYKRTQAVVLQFNAETGDWVQLSDMKYARYGAGAFYQDSVLHVIGGRPPNGTRYERLDLRESNWKQLADLPRGALYPGLTCKEAGGIVFAGGGGKKEVYAYDAKQNAWQELPSMVECREGHGLVYLNGTIHAVGGYWNPSVEVFDGVRWEIVKRFDLQTCERACRMVL